MDGGGFWLVGTSETLECVGSSLQFIFSVLVCSTHCEDALQRHGEISKEQWQYQLKF